jgi:hypothetical protein
MLGYRILSNVNAYIKQCLIYALTLYNTFNIVLSAYFYHGIPSSALRQCLWLGLIQA